MKPGNNPLLKGNKMYVTYKGKTYVICREYGSLYDLDDPDGIKDTLLGISKWKCSMPRDMYDEEESEE